MIGVSFLSLGLTQPHIQWEPGAKSAVAWSWPVASI